MARPPKFKIEFMDEQLKSLKSVIRNNKTSFDTKNRKYCEAS